MSCSCPGFHTRVETICYDYPSELEEEKEEEEEEEKEEEDEEEEKEEEEEWYSQIK